MDIKDIANLIEILFVENKELVSRYILDRLTTQRKRLADLVTYLDKDKLNISIQKDTNKSRIRDLYKEIRSDPPTAPKIAFTPKLLEIAKILSFRFTSNQSFGNIIFSSYFIKP